MTGRQANSLFVALLLALAFQPATAVHAQATASLAQAELSRQADTAHLEFKGLKSWRYELERSGAAQVTLTVPPLSEASLARLQSFNDPLVRKIKVGKSGPDGMYVIVVDLADADVESFDYQTDEPSRLIVDFYRKADSTEKTVHAESAGSSPAVKPTPKTSGKTARRSERPSTRRPAGDEFLNNSIEVPDAAAPTPAQTRLHFGIFDGGDDNYDRFRIKDYEIRDEAAIASRQNIYLPFPMLKMPVSELAKLMEQEPEYVIRPKDTRENKEARLLLALYGRKRYGVFLKTYDYFTKRYPESEYLEILKNVTANVHLKKWREEGTADEYDVARAMYNELVQKYPESPLREHNYLILAFMQMERGDALATLQTLEGYLKIYPKAPDVPQVRKAAAEAYMILRKFDEAANEYAILMRDYPKTDHAREAEYRLGDVPFAKGDFSAAIRQFESAIKALPAQEKTYPNADFNMAEARFWQKDYKRALNGYVRFVELYPNHEYGGYALTRIGELLGILGADQRRVMGAFLESYFRFPNHPGAKVARIRMLSQQMRGMKVKEEKKALAEIEGYADSLDLPGINEFTTLMISEGLTGRGEYQESLKHLIAYYQKNPTSANLDSFKARILRNIANELKDRVERGQFMSALQFYSQYAKTWLKNSDRIDVPYLVGNAFERAGAYDEAQTIYKQALAQRQRIQGTVEEKEKSVQEHLPSLATLHLRLANVLAQDRDFLAAHQQLKAIGKTDTLAPPELVERVRLSALIAEQRNEPARAREALMELAKQWKGDPALVAPVNLELSQTFLKLGDAKQAETYAEQVLAAEKGETQLEPKLIADAYTAKAEALLAQKKALGAVETYQKMLERFEDKLPLASQRYKAGEVLYKQGDLKGAGDMWAPLQGGANNYLYKIGQEKLEDTKWRDEYNKYINRIPAMAKQEGK